jgi:hypothetical protein
VIFKGLPAGFHVGASGRRAFGAPTTKKPSAALSERRLASK